MADGGTVWPDTTEMPILPSVSQTVTDKYEPIATVPAALPTQLDPNQMWDTGPTDVTASRSDVPLEHVELPNTLETAAPAQASITEPDAQSEPETRSETADVVDSTPKLQLQRAAIPNKLNLSSIAVKKPGAPPMGMPPTTRQPLKQLGTIASDIGYIVPHGDETTAKEVLAEHLAQNPGIGLVAKNNTRDMGGLDPNQLFEPKYANTPFRQQVESQLINAPGNNLIVSLHNTQHGAINSERNRSDAIAENQKGYPGYILTTDPEIYSVLKSSPYNVILQTKGRDPADHSLSRYAGDIGRKYINIEAALGDKVGQQKMLQAALAAYNRIKALKGAPLLAPIH